MSGGSIQRFRGVIERAGDGGGAFVSVPFDVERVFGRKRVPIEATIDAAPYRGTLVRMGGSNHILIVLKAIRQKIGKGPGDTVDVVLEEDLKPRRVTVPADLARALKGRPKARLFFRGLSHSNQKEYAGWIESARRAETRSRRIARTVALLAEGKLAR